jgi:hypothetical protein
MSISVFGSLLPFVSTSGVKAKGMPQSGQDCLDITFGFP